jgi:hypothetical protein
MNYKCNVSCSETLSKEWTRQAIDCYLTGCNCSKCTLYKVFFSKRNYKCMMKGTVIELIRKKGAPNIKRNDIQEQGLVL